jgi:hypothetical protein
VPRSTLTDAQSEAVGLGSAPTVGAARHLRALSAALFTGLIAGSAACAGEPGSSAEDARGAQADRAPAAEDDAGAIGDAGGVELDAEGGRDAASDPDSRPSDGGPSSTFAISGTITHDWVPAKDDYTEGGVRLDYRAIESRPSRRIFVEAIRAQSAAPVASAITDDRGRYALEVPAGETVRIRAHAEIRMSNAVPDGAPPDRCRGATWNAVAVDNTQQQAPYVMDGAPTYSAEAANADLHAALVYNNGYRDRTAAPFAVLDELVTEIELICEGDPAVQLPILLVNWSVNNVASGNDPSTGMLGTSYYARDDMGVSNLYLVGKAEVDTDEYDDHIVAHETGHFFEDRIYRGDNVGGDHAAGDVLDPTVAFGEGFGNSIAAMTFDDPIYVDTSGVMQAGGFDFDASASPTGNDRGVYSEASAEYLLWALYENRDATPRSGSYDRIHEILRSHQRGTDALTTVHAFAAYYNQVFGQDAEQLRELWSNALATPFDALCAGACTGTGDTADPFDVDNDIGRAYATTRRYPEGASGAMFGADFWRLYRALSSGANAATEHDQTRFGGYADPSNKLGAVRWYRFAGTGRMETASISNLGASVCADDVLDLSVLDRGVEIASDYSTGGCPTATFPTTAGRSYVLMLFGLDTDVPSWTTTVSPKRSAPIAISSSLEGEVSPHATHRIVLRATRRRAHESLELSVRGIDGAIVEAESVRSSGEVAAAVRVPEGTAGFVVVDAAGSINGKSYRTSRPFSIRATGVGPRRGGLGRLAADASKRPIVILDAR